MSANPDESYRVLLVEDSPDIAGLVMINLKRLGLTTFHAINGPKAVAFLDEHQPDLILLDLNLPGLNGWGVLEHAKKRYGQVRVIVTTANDDPSNRLVGKLQVVDRYLIKPYSPADLVALVKEMLQLE